MGAGLVNAAYALATADRFQDHRSMRLFVYMANRALDRDPRPSFYAGQSSMLEAIAGTDPGTMRRSLRRLREVGYIVLDEHQRAQTGRRSTYYLEDGTGHPLQPADTSEVTRQNAPSPGGADRPVTLPRLAGRSVPTGGADRPRLAGQNAPPKEEEEEEEETRASAPARSCRRHPNWEHSEPCRACASDRRAAETASLGRRPTTMSERLIDCGVGNHDRLPDGTCKLCENRDPLWEVA